MGSTTPPADEGSSPAGNAFQKRTAASRIFGSINHRQPITPQIHEALRRAITTLAVLPSESFSEKELSIELGVSRTPVREALIRLADEGLIDILPQRGSFVAPIRLQDVEEAQFIREALEVSVVRRLTGRCAASFLATARANLAEQAKAVAHLDRDLFLDLDEKLHRSFCEEAGLPKSWRVIQSVKLQMDRVRYLSLPKEGHLEELYEQHVKILAAIEAGDRDEAAACMTVHLKEILRTLRRLHAERPELFEP
ncbi:GntR family transcriptional regulator [Jiella pelagia]|uniref:GntR family transcriptional regulator n=1 Tax=Jiella pelagia TaxID=2986949 RepID=A0ABY7BXG4_9HYPH|nr:GntR family transcriptional regulator [Jiella pelagia]WAP68214.1 GntR family transcriptional regulator [Jiella pelagia]